MTTAGEFELYFQPLFDLHPNWRDAVRAAGEYGEFPGWEHVLD